MLQNERQVSNSRQLRENLPKLFCQKWSCSFPGIYLDHVLGKLAVKYDTDRRTNTHTVYVYFVISASILQPFSLRVRLAGVQVASTPKRLINADAFWFTVCHVRISLYAWRLAAALLWHFAATMYLNSIVSIETWTELQRNKRIVWGRRGGKLTSRISE